MLGSVISTKGINLKISSRLDSPCVSTQHKTDGYIYQNKLIEVITKEKQLQKMKTTDIQVGQFSYKT